MKDVLMLIHTMGSLEPTDNDRYTYLAKMLCEQDAQVEIVTSDFEHHKKAYRKQDVAGQYPFSFSFLHENAYQKNVSLKRILGHFSFAVRLERYLRKRKKPDVIYCAIPPTASAWVAAKYAKKNKIRFVIDVQDLWPESFQIVLGKNWLSRLLLKPLELFANGAYRRADAIIAVSNTYVQRVCCVNTKAQRKDSVYLGTDSDTVREALTGKAIEKPENEFWIGYVGNLGKSYDFLHLFQALALLKEKGIQNMQLWILGDGNLRKEVEELSATYFPETIFTGYLPYQEMFRYLKNCDIALNPIVKGAANSVVNKVGDYAAAGIPVVNTQDHPEYQQLLDEYQAGLNTIPEDTIDIAAQIETLYQNDTLRNEMGRNNLQLYEDKFDRKKTYPEIVNAILNNE